MSLQPYWGEFLVSPIPLEMSLNVCSHRCSYCFAVLNHPDRSANVKSIINLLQSHHDRTTLTALLLRLGHTVVVSNRVDPFANNNYRVAIPILRMMAAMGMRVAFQTRGGKGWEEVLEFVPPSVWYVSIPYWDDSIRKKIEPAAPELDHRYRLIEALIKKGHRVALGLNPAVPEWLPGDHVEKLLAEVKRLGVYGVWCEGIHLNPKQVERMPGRDREAIGEEIIVRARKRKAADEDEEIFLASRRLAGEMGLEVFSVGQPERSGFFDPYEELYPTHFPTAQSFVNHCHDRGLQPGDRITFDEWADFMTSKLPLGVYSIGHYLGTTARNIWRTHKLSNSMSYRQLLGIIWQDPRFRSCPVRMPNFAYVGRQNGKGWQAEVDEIGMYQATFKPEGILSFCWDFETGEFFNGSGGELVS